MNSRAASERGAGSGGDSVLGGPHRLLRGPTDLEDPGCVYVGPTQKVLGRRVPTLFMSGWVRAVLVTLSALSCGVACEAEPLPVEGRRGLRANCSSNCPRTKLKNIYKNTKFLALNKVKFTASNLKSSDIQRWKKTLLIMKKINQLKLTWNQHRP